MHRLFYIIMLCFFSHQVMAWEDHAILTKTVLYHWSENDKSVAVALNQSVKVETLQSFLEATQTTLPDKLLMIEHWAKQNEQGYKPIPEHLLYQPLHPDCSSNLETCFKKALRVNLDVPLPLIIYDPLHEYSQRQDYVGIMDARQILPSYIPVTFNISDFTLVPDHGQAKIADIIATASMQPDFGLDTFLYEDSGTLFGKIYGFGTQPFGNPALPFHSQMLFHMSAYHENPGILFFLPRLNENYPEYRAFLFMNLSRFAAETKHPYWSAVFLGWGLHYIQDLTEPYHTCFDYGLDTSGVLHAFSEIAKKNYLPFFQLETIQTNRHIMLENLTEYIMSSTVEDGYYRKMLHAGLADTRLDSVTPPCDLNTLYLRHQVSIVSPADYLSILESTIPSSYINSPEFHVDEMNDLNSLFLNEMNRSQRLRFADAMAQALVRYGVYTRACVASYVDIR